MKKSLLLVVAAAAAVVVALLQLFPEWARRLMGLVRPVTEAVKPLTGLGREARSTVPAPVAQAPGAATDAVTDALRPDLT
ncbi:MAG: hypothetical protein ACKOVB_13115 [Terrabacter sp.]